MNTNTNLAAASPITVTPAEFLAAFHPGPYHLRSFSDHGKGGGKNYQVSAAELATEDFLAGLHLANQAHRAGIFFVVNPGGHRDDEITTVAAHFVEADDLSLAQQYDNLRAFPLEPSLIVKTRKSLHGYWLLKNRAEMGEYPNDLTCNGRVLNESSGNNQVLFKECDNSAENLEKPSMTAAADHPDTSAIDGIDLNHPVGAVCDSPDTSVPALSSKGVTAESVFNQELATDRRQFRPIQKALAAVFQGDPVISNLSRVMRLPGFFHNKQEPVLVTCIKFDPQLRYTQAEITAALAAVTGTMVPAIAAAKPSTGTASIPGFFADTEMPDPQRMITSCAFLSHARDNAATLSEPLWYAMITQLAALPGGVAAIHGLSRDYPDYTAAATEKKIAQFKNTGAGPMTCETLKGWGYACPRRSSCPAKAPWELGKTPLPSWYRKKANGYRLMPGILANELAKHKRIFYAGEAYYQYLGGVYKMVDDRHCQKIVRKYLRPELVSMAQINDVLSQWTVEISRSAQGLNRDKGTINLKNGRYDLATGQLKPHDPNILSTIQLQAGFEKTAVAPIFMAFLADCLDADSQLLLQEIFGYLLIPETCAQKAFVFVGAGGAGKSTLLAVAQDVLLGAVNVANIPWQNLGDRFKTAELFGMLANIFADLPSKSLEDNGLFKSITGEDFITAERKNKDPFSFKATARLVFSCNSLPKNLGDRSEAFYRRLIIVPFLPPKPPAQRDLYLKDKLKNEAAGILNWALAGLARLSANHYCFSQSAKSVAALDAYRIAGSSVRSFVDERCALKRSNQAPATQLFIAYQHYCQESGLHPVSQKRFWMELKEAFPELEKMRDTVSRRALYTGITLLDLEEVA
ncbi:DNA primase family protein [Acetobacterium wieringae]|uniref:DNA primase family protein n=1 Tax=Acetobacterium wieringae TaxID=52694 RepID=UPI001DF0F262|nr:DNA primase family protein [Acetobacterium wieringae]VUZ29066.1 Uncharacterised protein [Acetobacterium wieringae]